MNRIREIRKEQKLTLNDVASKVGVSIPFLADLELGHRGAKDETMHKIAEVLGTTVDELIGGDDDEAADHRAGG